MIDKTRDGYQQADWELGTIAEMVRAMPPCDLVTVEVTDRIESVVGIFGESTVNQFVNVTRPDIAVGIYQAVGMLDNRGHFGVIFILRGVHR